MATPKWLQILETFGPMILAFTPLAPIAPAVTAAIGAAETTALTGTDKLAQVVQVAGIAAEGVNAQVGHQVIDPSVVAASAASAISAVVQIANSVHDGGEVQATAASVKGQ
jgi:hypothetical protein